jgi:hypothetical protein
MQLALTAIVLSACGCGTAPVAAEPLPTFSAYDLELLAQLQVVDFQIYETPVTIGGYSRRMRQRSLIRLMFSDHR